MRSEMGIRRRTMVLVVMLVCGMACYTNVGHMISCNQTVLAAGNENVVDDSVYLDNPGYPYPIPQVTYEKPISWGNVCTGDGVKWIQTFLNYYYHENLYVDGSFGPTSDKWVKRFQKDMGLVVDGIVGVGSRDKMLEEWRRLKSIELEETEPPQITHVQVIFQDSEKYVIQCKAFDNVRVAQVKTGTWWDEQPNVDLDTASGTLSQENGDETQAVSSEIFSENVRMWQTEKINGEDVTINIHRPDDAKGALYFHTCIYAYDYMKNYSAYIITVCLKAELQPEAEMTDAITGHSYQLYSENRDYEQAQKECERLGGHLLTVGSRTEQDTITELMKQAYELNYFIGAYQEDDEWNWITKESFRYNHWNAGKPEEGEGTDTVAVITKDTGKWSNCDPQYQYGFILETEPHKEEISTDITSNTTGTDKSEVTKKPIQQETISPVETAVLAYNNESVLKKVANLICDTSMGNSIVLRWNGTDGVTYEVYRATKMNGKYKKIASNCEKNYFQDETVKGIKKYYYMVRAVKTSNNQEQFSPYSVIQTGSISGLMKPQISLKKRKTPDHIKYIQLDLKHVQGTYFQIYVKKGKEEYKKISLKKNTVASFKSGLKICYKTKNKKLKIKVRTYKQKGSKKYYSPYSDEISIQS